VENDRVVVQGSFHGVLKDGSVSDTEFADIFVIKDNKVVDRHTYFDGPSV
jgi:ketosteroid isomerase-like protein